MGDQNAVVPDWLAPLTDQVRRHQQTVRASDIDQRPALLDELSEIDGQDEGWLMSLGKKLPPSVREAILAKLAGAVARRAEIEANLNELEVAGGLVEELARPDQVLERINRLADVLADGDPTRGNLELSMHIDRVVCRKDGTATMRMCKLGVMPDAVAMCLNPAGTAEQGPNPEHQKARRRGRLRIVDDDAQVDPRAQADFAADPNRFAGLGDEWFWIDVFQVPGRSPSWSAANAEAVFKRRQETRASYAKLAAEFGVRAPTIGAAIRHYLKTHPGERDMVELRRGGKRRPKFDLAKIADEAWPLWNAGWSKERLARKFVCSAPTIVKALKYACEREGASMPSQSEIRRAKVAEARRLLQAGTAQEQIATSLRTSVSTVRTYLRESFAAEGKRLPDLRRRRSA